ncbi:calcium-activated chloride channel regulator 1-like, partial [Lingula anatina]|uniref:Calcium-activated chloride channel regulator 1-like n=1 Tax=Lingula anatina TaxID=7574 RepID=A0A1S3ISA9_LINAN
QTYWTEASRALYLATQKRAYFRNITILVPSTWSAAGEFREATTQVLDKAHVIVDKPNSLYGDTPYVKQPRGCGQRGEYMHLTHDFILNRQRTEQFYGNPGTTLVHEWGHLQWGLFDEHPMPDHGYGHFYAGTDGRVKPVTCTENVKGAYKSRVDGSICKVDLSTSMPEEECIFIPEDVQSAPRASVMAHHYLSSVSLFCDNDPHTEATYHNIEAKNKHNDLCYHKSAWEVMRDHPDFKDGANPPATVDPTPAFHLVQHKEVLRVVVVMDISGSMRENNNHLKLQRAVQRFVLNTVPENTLIGLVEFNEKARNLTVLEKIDSQHARIRLADKVPLRAENYTSIGNGIKKGIELLEYMNRNPAGGILVLITDGNETMCPCFNHTLPELRQKGITVNTVLYTKNADHNLAGLTKHTNGDTFFYSGKTNSTALDDAMTTFVSQRTFFSSSVLILVQSESLVVPAHRSVERTVNLDSTIGNRTTFTVSWETQTQAQIAIEVMGPGLDHSIVGERRDHYVVVMAPNISKPGKWTTKILNPSNVDQTVVFRVESHSLEGVEPIKVSANIQTQSNTYLVNSTDGPPILYADVGLGYSPIVGASVSAEIETSSGMVLKVPLYDNGTGADTTAGDGVYSAYFLDYVKATGDYSVKVKVENDLRRARMMVNGTAAGGSSAMRKISLSNPGTMKPEPVALEKFNRVALSGFFKVTGVPNLTNPSTDIFPPSRIRDLRVVEASHAKSVIILEFTAVGDDYQSGTAARYEVRVGENVRQFFESLHSVPTIESHSNLQCDLPLPSPAGTRERLVIAVNSVDVDVSYSFGVRAMDEVGNWGEISVITTASLKNSSHQLWPTPPVKTVHFYHHIFNHTAVYISSATVGGVFLICIAIGALLICRYRRRNGSAGSDADSIQRSGSGRSTDSASSCNSKESPLAFENPGYVGEKSEQPGSLDGFLYETLTEPEVKSSSGYQGMPGDQTVKILKLQDSADLRQVSVVDMKF